MERCFQVEGEKLAGLFLLLHVDSGKPAQGTLMKNIESTPQIPLSKFRFQN